MFLRRERPGDMKLYKLLIALLIMIANVYADNWPGFRNDIHRSGVSKETGLLKQWPAEGPKLLWSIEGKFGLGWSGCSIVDGIVYTAGMDEKSRNGVLYAIGSDGNIIWQTDYGVEWFKSFKGARCTPVVVNGKVCIETGNGLLSCLSSKDGKILWQKDLWKDYDAKAPRFGGSETPLVVDGKVFCAPGGTKASLVALDADTGNEIWVTESTGQDLSYCSPAYYEHNGKKYITIMLSDLVIGVDMLSGKKLWQLKYEDYEQKGPGYGGDVKANSPQYVDGKLFMSSGYDKGSIIAQLSEDGNAVSITKYIPDFDNHHHGIVYIDGYFYASVWDSNENGKWLCVELSSGDVKYSYDWDGGKGVIIAAGRYLYCINEKTGKVALVKAEPADFNIISEFQIPGGSGEYWSHPSISEGRLYIRHGDSLFVYDIAAK